MVTVTFNVGDAVGGPLPASVPQGGQLTAPGTDGLTNGTLTFGGWFTDSTLRYPVEFPLTVTGDMTVYAKWDHENVLVIWPNKSWNMMGQNVQLQAGVTYTLGAEYKLGKAGAYYGRLAFSVRYYSGSALVSMPLITFTEGGPLAWTRAETTFVAPVSGWYTIRIPDPGAWAPDAPDQVAVEAYVNRTWLYAANSTENKLGDADFAKSTSIWSTANNSPDRFLDSNTTSCWPWYTNNPPAWVKSEWEDSGGSGGYWQPSCRGYWGGASAASFAIQQNPNAKNQ
jgi:uncharacterized repeat protein (TIGR02543 family)